MTPQYMPVADALCDAATAHLNGVALHAGSWGQAVRLDLNSPQWWTACACEAERAAHEAFKSIPGLRVLLILAALLPAYVQAQDDSTMRCGVESRHTADTNARDSVGRFGGPRGRGVATPKPLSCFPLPGNDNRDRSQATGAAGIASGHRSVESSWKLLALYGSASAADLLSTELALARNPYAREANPLMGNRAVRIAGQAGVVAVMTLATQHAQRNGHPGRARALKVGFVLLKVGLAVHNVRQAGRQQ